VHTYGKVRLSKLRICDSYL